MTVERGAPDGSGSTGASGTTGSGPGAGARPVVVVLTPGPDADLLAAIGARAAAVGHRVHTVALDPSAPTVPGAVPCAPPTLAPVGPGWLAPGYLVAEHLRRLGIDAGATAGAAAGAGATLGAVVVAPTAGGVLWAVAAERRQGHAFAGTALVAVGESCAARRRREGRRHASFAEAVGDALEAAVAGQAAPLPVPGDAAAVDARAEAIVAAFAGLVIPPAPRPADPGPVSAIITHYERPVLLRRAIDSLLAQTRPPAEIVVVDDGSPSAAAAHALAELERLPLAVPLRVVRQANAGLGAARNHGIEVAAHPLVAFLDDDDEAEPTYLARMAGALAATGATAVAVGFKVFPDAVGPLLALDEASRWLFAAEAASLAAVDNVIGGAAALLRADAVRAVGGYHTRRGLAYEDWDLLVRLHLAGHRVETVPEALLRYRVSSSSMLRTYPVLDSHDLVLDGFRAGLPPEVAAWPELLCALATAVDGERSRAGAVEAELAAAKAALAAAEEELSRLRAVEAQHAAVLASSSWRAGRALVSPAARARGVLGRWRRGGR